MTIGLDSISDKTPLDASTAAARRRVRASSSLRWSSSGEGLPVDERGRPAPASRRPQLAACTTISPASRTCWSPSSSCTQRHRRDAAAACVAERSRSDRQDLRAAREISRGHLKVPGGWKEAWRIRMQKQK